MTIPAPPGGPAPSGIPDWLAWVEEAEVARIAIVEAMDEPDGQRADGCV